MQINYFLSVFKVNLILFLIEIAPIGSEVDALLCTSERITSHMEYAALLDCMNVLKQLLSRAQHRPPHWQQFCLSAIDVCAPSASILTPATPSSNLSANSQSSDAVLVSPLAFLVQLCPLVDDKLTELVFALISVALVGRESFRATEQLASLFDGDHRGDGDSKDEKDGKGQDAEPAESVKPEDAKTP